MIVADHPAHSRVGARVQQHLDLEGENVAVVGDGRLDVEALLPGLARDGQVLAAVLGPFDRTAELLGQRRRPRPPPGWPRT